MLTSIMACLAVAMCVLFVMKCVDMFLEAPTEVKYTMVILILVLLFYTSYRTRSDRHYADARILSRVLPPLRRIYIKHFRPSTIIINFTKSPN